MNGPHRLMSEYFGRTIWEGLKKYDLVEGGVLLREALRFKKIHTFPSVVSDSCLWMEI